MNLHKSFVTLTLVAIVALAATRTHAAALYSVPTVVNRDDVVATVGLSFTPTSNLLVTDLGYFDDDDVADADGGNDDADRLGNASSHQVGLWDASSLLASVTVQAGTLSPLTGQYRYEAITPIVLTAGVKYWLGATVDNTAASADALRDIWPDLGSSYTSVLPFTLLEGTAVVGAGLIKPTGVFSTGNFYKGPNLLASVVEVPEPSAFLLIGLGMIGILRLTGRRRFQHITTCWNTRNLHKTIAMLTVVIVVALAAASAQASPLYSNPGGTPRDNAGGTVGLSFFPTSDLLVTDLGYFDDDGDGNVISHQVGLWNTTSLVPLALVTVQAGTASSLVGQYRYEAITPITLTAGVQYRLGARIENASGDVWPDLSGTFTLILPVTNIHARYDLAAGLNRPDVDAATGGFYQAPNLIASVVEVPEPGAVTLAFFGIAGLCRVVRKRR
jgi:hypothetical protein